MAATAQFDTVSEARKQMKDLLDAAESGRPASVRRESHVAAVVDADRLRQMLAGVRPASAQIVPEAGGWSIFLPGLPLAADGSTVEEALEDMVLVLREYSEDWTERLLNAPNHKDNWGLVQLISLSDDQQVKDWLVGQ